MGQDPEARLRAAEEEARAAGYEAGLSEGRIRAGQESEARVSALAASIGALAGVRAEVLRRSEQDLLRLATRIAEAIVRDRIEAGPEVAVRALRDALGEVPRNEPLAVRCHPDEEPALAAFLAGSSETSAACTLRPDPSMAPGGCIVESAMGEIDVRVETQLRILERELLARS